MVSTYSNWRPKYLSETKKKGPYMKLKQLSFINKMRLLTRLLYPFLSFCKQNTGLVRYQYSVIQVNNALKLLWNSFPLHFFRYFLLNFFPLFQTNVWKMKLNCPFLAYWLGLELNFNSFQTIFSNYTWVIYVLDYVYK